MDGVKAKRWVLGGCAATAALLGALAMASLSGCAAGSVQGGFTITDGSVEVSGPTLTVSLEADDATGEAWSQSLEGQGLEYDTMVHHSDEGNPEETADTVDYDVFTYTGTSAGDQTVTFAYGPGTQPDDQETKVVVVTTTTNASGEIISCEATGSDGSQGSLK